MLKTKQVLSKYYSISLESVSWVSVRNQHRALKPYMVFDGIFLGILNTALRQITVVSPARFIGRYEMAVRST